MPGMKHGTVLALAATLVLGGPLPAAAPRADYAGFWKENCNDPYGLQIKPYRGDTYTITFCGPGSRRCGEDTDPHSATAIAGDPGYEILGPERIRIRYAQGYAPVYIRCTTDLQPVLEYPAADQAEGQRRMIIVALVHLGYLLGTAAAYVLLHRRMRGLPPGRRRLYRTALAALLFAPGLLWSWPFVSPTFALLALAVFLADLSPASVAMLPAQLFYSVGPMLAVWGLLLAGAVLWRKWRPEGP